MSRERRTRAAESSHSRSTGKVGTEVSPFAATATATRPQQVMMDEKPTQLERVVGFESARWLPTLLSNLRLLETTGSDVPGVGDLRISATTADHVRKLLSAISTTPLPEPVVSPFSGGGIALVCTIGERELMFTAYPGHDDFIFSRTNDQGKDIDDGVLTLDESDGVGEIVSKFLRNAPR